MLTLLLPAAPSFATGNKTAYTLFTGKGEKITYARMMRDLARCDILLFGELHNNPIAHWLQYEVTESLHGKRDLVLGAEMFEADNQQPLDDYLSGKIDRKGLDTLARLWPNFKTDYAPLVDYAKTHGLRFIATNIPRRYANLVFKRISGPSTPCRSWKKAGWPPSPSTTTPPFRAMPA